MSEEYSALSTDYVLEARRAQDHTEPSRVDLLALSTPEDRKAKAERACGASRLSLS